MRHADFFPAAVFFILLWAGSSGAATNAGVLEYRQGMVTCTAQSVSLFNVVEKIALAANLNIFIPDQPEDVILPVEFHQIPVMEAISRLLKGHSFAVVYIGEPDNSAKSVVLNDPADNGDQRLYLDTSGKQVGIRAAQGPGSAVAGRTPKDQKNGSGFAKRDPERRMASNHRVHAGPAAPGGSHSGVPGAGRVSSGVSSFTSGASGIICMEAASASSDASSQVLQEADAADAMSDAILSEAQALERAKQLAAKNRKTGKPD